MFDNPRKELERLQQELLAAEQPEETPPEEAFPEDGYLPMEWEDDDRLPLSQNYIEEQELPDWDFPQPRSQEPECPPETPEKKHYVGLKFAIALELLGIAALFWWWYLWIR